MPIFNILTAVMGFPGPLDQVVPLLRGTCFAYESHSSCQVLVAPSTAPVNEMPVHKERLQCRAELVVSLGRNTDVQVAFRASSSQFGVVEKT